MYRGVGNGKEVREFFLLVFGYYGNNGILKEVELIILS